MIKQIKCKETQAIWEGKASRKLPHDIQDRALRKLRQLDAALTLDDLKHPPGNHLEALEDDRIGQMSIRINKQWRICFVWNNGEPTEIEITDYH